MGTSRPARIDFWDEDNQSLSLFAYKPVRSRQYDEARELILGFKNSDPEYLSAAVEQVCYAFQAFGERWRCDLNCRYIVPVPSHTASQVSESSELVCTVLSGVFPWLQYPKGLLFRRMSVQPAHMIQPWERRLTPKEHFESLACGDIDLVEGAGIILFDDVRTSGNTSQGCRWRLKQDTHCGQIVRVFLARTET